MLPGQTAQYVVDWGFNVTDDTYDGMRYATNLAAYLGQVTESIPVKFAASDLYITMVNSSGILELSVQTACGDNTTLAQCNIGRKLEPIGALHFRQVLHGP